ncbi:MAG: MarR family transcriptional regulator [Xanthomonadales bacterium]|nr:MarR family transcriptional regulator [Xanthomonadales bacterium]
MQLKPQDLMVMLKLVAMADRSWTYAGLAEELGISISQLHSAVQRALVSGLAVRSNGSIVPNRPALQEFILHGLKYVFFPERGELTRGMPTAHAAPPLDAHFADSGEPPPVWPDPEGSVRGMAFAPLYKLAPRAARTDPALYELLVLIDAIRGGRARERAMAASMLESRLKPHESST